MASKICVLCGRVGTAGFDALGQDGVVCLRARACVRRMRTAQAAAAEDPRWKDIQRRALLDLDPSVAPGSAHPCSVEYATDVLDQFGLADWGWLVDDLAAGMDDAALDFAEQWWRENCAALRCPRPRTCRAGARVVAGPTSASAAGTTGDAPVTALRWP